MCSISKCNTYAPVSKLTTVRLLLALSAQYGWNVDHMDVVTAFLNPKIDRDKIHMATPPGIEWLEPYMPDGSTLLLRKALYGLKQVPRLWFKDINGYLLSIGFQQSAEDPNLYLQPRILLILYVDDLLIAYDGRTTAQYCYPRKLSRRPESITMPKYSKPIQQKPSAMK